MKVLLLEDDTGVGSVLRQCLELWDHQVVHQLDGRTAWQSLATTSFGMLITDWSLPDTNGTEFVRRLRHTPRLAHMPVLMISGRTSQQDIIEAMRAGVNEFLPKPFTPKQLQAKLKTLHLYSQNALNPDQLAQVFKQQVKEPSRCDALVLLGDPATSVEDLLRPDRSAMAQYLVRFAQAIKATNEAHPETRIGYQILPNTYDIANLIKKPLARKVARLVAVSTDCIGNSLSLARSLSNNSAREFGIALVSNANRPFTPQERSSLGRMDVEMFLRPQLNADALRALLQKYVTDKL